MVDSTTYYFDDRDMPCSSFPFIIGVDARGPLREQRAREIFAALKITRRYALVLVHDSQRKLDEYYPAR